MFRVREKVDGKRIAAWRKLARDAGYRTGLDLHVVERTPLGPSKAKEKPPAGTVVVQVKGEKEFHVPGQKKPLDTVEALKKHLEKAQPDALKAAQKAGGKDAKPRIQLVLKLGVKFVDLVKGLHPLTTKGGYGGIDFKFDVPLPESGITRQEKQFEIDR
jgi:hypothetical protein